MLTAITFSPITIAAVAAGCAFLVVAGAVMTYRSRSIKQETTEPTLLPLTKPKPAELLPKLDTSFSKPTPTPTTPSNPSTTLTSWIPNLFSAKETLPTTAPTRKPSQPTATPQRIPTFQIGASSVRRFQVDGAHLGMPSYKHAEQEAVAFVPRFTAGGRGRKEVV
ncbi:hypothetical protein HDV05_000404 [Chytridiales sp. JEL 0842]|nr:hypothetical protein HDV05_000404 [Chytridiales sp. JEL 0842]